MLEPPFEISIREHRSRATNHRKAARAVKSRAQAAEAANIDDLMSENIQLKEINKFLLLELQRLRLRERSQKGNDDAERTRRQVRPAAGSIESLQEQLATSRSLFDALEKEKEDHGRQIDDLQKMVSDLTEKLASAISELGDAKEELKQKERKVDKFENSTRVSGRDLDRSRRSLRDKIQNTRGASPKNRASLNARRGYSVRSHLSIDSNPYIQAIGGDGRRPRTISHDAHDPNPWTPFGSDGCRRSSSEPKNLDEDYHSTPFSPPSSPSERRAIAA